MSRQTGFSYTFISRIPLFVSRHALIKLQISLCVTYKNIGCMFLSFHVRVFEWIHILARNRPDIWSLCDCNASRTHNHVVRKPTLNHLAKLASLAKWLNVRLRTKCLWVRIPLMSLKLELVPTSSKEFLDIQANYRVWIHSGTRMWHDNDMHLKIFFLLWNIKTCRMDVGNCTLVIACRGVEFTKNCKKPKDRVPCSLFN